MTPEASSRCLLLNKGPKIEHDKSKEVGQTGEE